MSNERRIQIEIRSYRLEPMPSFTPVLCERLAALLEHHVSALGEARRNARGEVGHLLALSATMRVYGAVQRTAGFDDHAAGTYFALAASTPDRGRKPSVADARRAAMLHAADLAGRILGFGADELRMDPDDREIDVGLALLGHVRASWHRASPEEKPDIAAHACDLAAELAYVLDVALGAAPHPSAGGAP